MKTIAACITAACLALTAPGAGAADHADASILTTGHFQRGALTVEATIRRGVTVHSGEARPEADTGSLLIVVRFASRFICQSTEGEMTDTGVALEVISTDPSCSLSLAATLDVSSTGIDIARDENGVVVMTTTPGTFTGVITGVPATGTAAARKSASLVRYNTD